MKTPNEKNRFRWRIIAGILGLSLCGLFTCAMIEKIFGIKANDDKTSLLYILMFVFSVIWVFGLAVLVPVQILYFERKERKNKPPEKMTLSDVAGLPFGTYNPNAELPKWISIPVKIVLWGLVSLFVLCSVLALIGIIGGKFYSGNA